MWTNSDKILEKIQKFFRQSKHLKISEIWLIE